MSGDKVSKSFGALEASSMKCGVNLAFVIRLFLMKLYPGFKIGIAAQLKL